MPRLGEFQFIIQPVLLLYEDGKPPRPTVDPDAQMVLNGLDELRAYADQFTNALAKLNETLQA